MSDTPKLLALMAKSRDVNALDYSKQLEVLVRELERENAALRNEVVRLNNQTMWICSCGGTDCAGQKENAALRADLDRLDSGTIVLPVRGEPVIFVGTDLRAAIDAGMRKAQA